MPLVYSHENHTFRVDGDVLETFLSGLSQQRTLLTGLSVRVHPRAKGKFPLYIGSAPPDWPLYEVLAKPRVSMATGASLLTYIDPDEEPALRAFFTQVALMADRRVAT